MRQIKHTQVLLFMWFCLMVAVTLRFPDLQTVPPGVHFDEAANGILAAEIGRGERFPVFIASYTGKEVLFFYLAGGLMRLIGESVFALRLTAALVGVLTIAAVYWLGTELFRDRRVALVAAALLAISFWHLLFSHLGFRAITQPLLQTLTIAALWRGLRRQERRWAVMGGLFLSLTAYTYLAARLFPILLLLALLPLLFNWRRTEWKAQGKLLLLFGGVGAVVLAPLLAYFVTHPDAFWVRITQVAPGESGLSLGESFLKSLQMLFLLGDPYWRFNLPGRPLFDWFWGGLLLVGWIILLLRQRQPLPVLRRAGGLLLLLAPFTMLLPTALAVNEIVPSNLRAIGLIPFVFYLPGVGLMTLVADLEKRFDRPPLTPAVLTISVLALMVGGLYVERLYYRFWAEQPEVYFETDGDLTAVAAFLDTLDTGGKQLYVSALHYQHPTLAFLSQKYGEIKWLPQSDAIVFPESEPAVYIYPYNSPLPDWARPYLESARELANASSLNGPPAFTAYELSRTPALSPMHTVNANFGNVVTLLGYDVMEVNEAGENLPIRLYWQINRQPSADYTPFVHLEDAWGHRWAQVETFAYPAPQWQTGETVVQQVDLPLPAGAPPGSYRLRLGFFVENGGERLPYLDENGRYAGNTYAIVGVSLPAAQLPDTVPQPPFVLAQEIRPQLHLLGYERGGLDAFTGENLNLALWWQATDAVPHTSTRLELLRTDTNSGRILLNTQPVHDTYPFVRWETPQFLIDRLSARIPNNMPPGEYRLTARFLDAAEETLATADLGPVTVKETVRTFTPPPLSKPLAATLGGEIKLLGYGLEPIDATALELTLVWQALTPPAADYTAFVHLLQQDGSCNPCLWQQDVMPQQNQYPTSRWLADEVVVDRYRIEIPEGTPPGSYPLEVGLYLAENGRRLQVTIPGQNTTDVVQLAPLKLP